MAEKALQRLQQAAADSLVAMKAKREEIANAKTDEERDKLKAEFAALKAKDKAILEDLDEEKALADRERAAPPVRDDDSAAAQQAVRGAHVEVGKNRSLEDPMKGFKSPRDFCMAVMDAGRGKKLDARLVPLKQAAAGSDEQGGYSDPYGGFLVPEGMAPTLMQLRPEDDPITPRTTKIPMNTPVVPINARVDKDHTTSVSGGLVVTRRPETVDGNSSRMKFEQIKLTASTLFGLGFATEEILTDSPQSFAAILAAGFRDEFTAKGIDERLNGTGVGEPLGVLHANCPCTISVPKEVGQDADTINYENIKKMRSRCWRYSGAVWLANHDTLPQLLSLNQVVGVGGVPIWQASAQDDAPDILLGRPLFFTEYCNKLGDAGDIVLGVWSEYLDGTLQPLQSAESIHVRFAAHERCFKSWLRNDGQPWWRSALTPKKSTQTLSPFVTLAAR
jgi:HK97 family phage major capsid protein